MSRDGRGSQVGEEKGSPRPGAQGVGSQTPPHHHFFYIAWAPSGPRSTPNPEIWGPQQMVSTSEVMLHRICVCVCVYRSETLAPFVISK